MEEMMPYNEPKLIEKVFSFKIPTISAIGHETDFTLLDYVSDLRAPTPSAAPNQKEITNFLKRSDINMNRLMNSTFKDYEYRIKSFISIIKISTKKIYLWQEKISFIITQNINNYKNLIDFNINKIQVPFNKINFNNPNYKLSQKKNYLENYCRALDKIFSSRFNSYSQKIQFQERLIKNSSIEKNLKKGYSLIFNKKKLIKTKKEFDSFNHFKVKFSDGESDINNK